MRNFKVLICLSLLAFFGNANSQDTPPPGTVEACADKGEGDACDFVNNRGDDINGFCRTTNVNGEGKLVCVAPQL